MSPNSGPGWSCATRTEHHAPATGASPDATREAFDDEGFVSDAVQ